jgi:hypothetical protein
LGGSQKWELKTGGSQRDIITAVLKKLKNNGSDI